MLKSSYVYSFGRLEMKISFAPSVYANEASIDGFFQTTVTSLYGFHVVAIGHRHGCLSIQRSSSSNSSSSSSSSKQSLFLVDSDITVIYSYCLLYANTTFAWSLVSSVVSMIDSPHHQNTRAHMNGELYTLCWKAHELAAFDILRYRSRVRHLLVSNVATFPMKRQSKAFFRLQWHHC